MKMSDEKICEFYRFQAKDGYGRQAIDSLTLMNKCQTDEIVIILQENGLAMKYYEKQEDKTMAKPNPNKESIIRDYNNGMSCNQIGERYGQNPKVIYNNLKRWGVWKGKEKEPASAATETSPKNIDFKPTESIPQKSENVKSEDMVEWLSWLIDTSRTGLDAIYGRGDGTYSNCCKITAARAENEKNKAAVSFTANGKVYSLTLEVYE